MNRYRKPEEFLKTNYCVIEPIDKAFNEIKTNDSKKIIVTGGRGVGKTLVLCNCNEKTKNTSSPIIFTRFDSIGLFSQGLENIIEPGFYEHYYEIIMSFKLLNYIKEQCKLYDTESKEYKKLIVFEDKLKIYDQKLVNYIKNVCYDDRVSLQELLGTGELTEELLNKAKEYFRLKKISLAIDRFDWTNSNNKLSQEALSKYFDMFDKVIITSDDNSILEQTNREQLTGKGYSFVDLKYGQELSIVQNIIKGKIEQCNQDFRNLEFNYNNISEETYKKMIDKSNGNISLMLYSTSYAYDTYQWEAGEWSPDKCLDFALEAKIEENKKLTKMMKTPKLYL